MLKPANKKSLLRLIAAMGVSLSATAGHSQDLGPTLEKIKSSGVMTIAVRDGSFPYSYLNDDGTHIGYSMDIANAVVEQVKKETGKPALVVKKLPVTSQNRIVLIQNGTTQIECGSTTNNTSRQQQVAFSNTFFIIGVRMLVPKSSAVKTYDELKGKTVVTVAGTTPERLIRSMNEEKKLGMNVISANDTDTAFITLQSGRAAAYIMDDAPLAGMRAAAKDPSNWVIVGEPLSREAYGCMLPKADAQFKALVDRVIAERSGNGEAVKTYNKWFVSTIPPKNVSLNFELSDDMKALFAKPNDTAFQ